MASLLLYFNNCLSVEGVVFVGKDVAQLIAHASRRANLSVDVAVGVAVNPIMDLRMGRYKVGELYGEGPVYTRALKLGSYKLKTRHMVSGYNYLFLLSLAQLGGEERKASAMLGVETRAVEQLVAVKDAPEVGDAAFRLISVISLDVTPQGSGYQISLLGKWNYLVVNGPHIRTNIHLPTGMEIVNVGEFVELVIARNDYHFTETLRYEIPKWMAAIVVVAYISDVAAKHQHLSLRYQGEVLEPGGILTELQMKIRGVLQFH